jgi:hypothetical protein
MNRQIAIALLSLTLVGAAVAQKTNGILVEVDSQRIADESWANGRISDGNGRYFVVEVTEVATKETHVIACQKAEKDCGLGTIDGRIPNHSRYLMKYIQSAYPDNAKLFDDDNSRYPLQAGGGVELTGAVQVLDGTVEPAQWVKMTGGTVVTHFFILKQKRAIKVCSAAVTKNAAEGKCTLERIRMGLQSEESCRCDFVDTPQPVPVEKLPCEVCSISNVSSPNPADTIGYLFPGAHDPSAQDQIQHLRTMLIDSIAQTAQKQGIEMHAEINGDAYIVHCKLLSSTQLHRLVGQTALLNLLQRAQIKEYVMTNDAGYTGHYDVASGKMTE